MERLTMRNSDGSYSQPMTTTFEKVFYKLAKFEDFMEDQGIESLEELKTFKALKDGWEKLKGSIYDRLEFFGDIASSEDATEYAKGKYYLLNELYEEILELEKAVQE